MGGAGGTGSGARGLGTRRLVWGDLPDRGVWGPMRTPDAAVCRDLAVPGGSVVTLSTASLTEGTAS